MFASPVRTDDPETVRDVVGFMGQEMWNVMTSRNQECLVVVINSDTFLACGDPMISGFIEHMLDLAKSEGIYIELTPDKPTPWHAAPGEFSRLLKVLKEVVPQRHARSKRGEAPPVGSLPAAALSGLIALPFLAHFAQFLPHHSLFASGLAGWFAHIVSSPWAGAVF